MEVILLEKVHKLGNIGDKVNVTPGYGRNYLIPHSKAVPATEANLVAFEQRRTELEKISAENLSEAQKRAETISRLKITIHSKAGDEGKLYGSVGTRDIAQAITTAGEKVTKSEVKLPTGSIRQAGEHEIMLQLHSDVRIKVMVTIIPSNT